MDLLVLQGDVDEFREIMGIINRDMDLVTLSDENLRRVFMIFEIAFGVVNARTKPVDREYKKLSLHFFIFIHFFVVLC